MVCDISGGRGKSWSCENLRNTPFYFFIKIFHVTKIKIFSIIFKLIMKRFEES